MGTRQSQGRVPLGDRAWQGAGTDWQRPVRLSSTLCQCMGSRGCFSEKLLPPKVEYESGFGATLITAGSIGSARPSKIQLQPWGPACSALRCLSLGRHALPGCRCSPALAGPAPSPGRWDPILHMEPAPRLLSPSKEHTPPGGRAADGGAPALQGMASAARGTPRTPEDLPSPNAWSRSVVPRPAMHPGHKSGSTQ